MDALKLMIDLEAGAKQQKFAELGKAMRESDSKGANP
jgi:hypothetical protein